MVISLSASRQRERMKSIDAHFFPSTKCQYGWYVSEGKDRNCLPSAYASSVHMEEGYKLGKGSGKQTARSVYM